jgi:hypothetical protein
MHGSDIIPQSTSFYATYFLLDTPLIFQVSMLMLVLDIKGLGVSGEISAHEGFK